MPVPWCEKGHRKNTQGFIAEIVNIISHDENSTLLINKAVSVLTSVIIDSWTNIVSINPLFKNAIINKVQKIKLIDGKTKILKQIP